MRIFMRSILQAICWFIVLELQTNGIIFPARSSCRTQHWFPCIVELLDWHFWLIWTLEDFSLKPLLLISSSARTQELAGGSGTWISLRSPHISLSYMWFIILCPEITVWQPQVGSKGPNSNLSWFYWLQCLLCIRWAHAFLSHPDIQRALDALGSQCTI